jgi:hypothetical protein
MKKVVLFLVLILGVFVGCKNSIKNQGEIIVPNGKGEDTKIAYTCDSCHENIQTAEAFNSVIESISKEVKNSLKYPLSFVPQSIDMKISTIIGKYYYSSNEPIENAYYIDYICKYIAKNAYNAESEGEYEGITYIGNGNVVDISKLMRLDSLYIIKSGDRWDIINRSLFLSNEKDDDYIKITPQIKIDGNKNKLYLDVKTSFSCVDEGTKLTFHFVDFSEADNLELKSWNDFNCDGKSYYELNSQQIEHLKGKKVQFISMYYKKSILCFIDSNKQDYFDQLASLLKE